MHSTLQPINSASAESLSEAVYESLLEAVVSGRLPSGSILSEVSLAKSLQVSRTPVHDALRQLAKDGLVEQQTGHRARVVQFTADDVYEIFEIRKYLEGPAAELAAGRMDTRQLSPLKEAADRLTSDRRSPDWLARWVEFDDLFHRTIAESCGNRRLSQDIHRYRLLHRGFKRMGAGVDVLHQALAEHIAILDALLARNGKQARDAMVAHIAAWQDFFIRHFPRS